MPNFRRFGILGFAALTAFTYWFMLQRTRLGLEMRAVVDARQLASIRGVSERHVSRWAWAASFVSAGLVDITFTLVPKNEWDVAAGVALVTSGGGFVSTLENRPLQCNRRDPLISGLIASGPHLREPLLSLLESHMQPAGSQSSRE